MDLDSPDVEKDFPGLYASESTESGKLKKNKDESDCKYLRQIRPLCKRDIFLIKYLH